METGAARHSGVARIAGIVGLAGGLLGAVSDAYELATLPTEVTMATSLRNALVALMLTIGLVGLAALGATGSWWWGRVGIGAAILSYAVLVGGELIEPFDPAAAAVIFENVALPFGLGMVLAGVAVLRAHRWSGWRRFVPLAMGAYVLVVFLPVVIVTGSDAGFWAAVLGLSLLFAALGLAVVREATTSTTPRVPSGAA